MPFIESPTGEPRRDPQYAVSEVVGIDKQFFDVGDPWTLVSDRFEATAGYADRSYWETDRHIEEVKHLIEELEVFNIPSIDVTSPEVPAIDYGSRPTVGTLELNNNWPPNSSEKPDLDNVPTINIPVIPTLTVKPPTINIPDRPDEREITDPGKPVPIREIDVPIAPSVTLPDAPKFSDIIIPSTPSITIPDFDETLLDEFFENPESFNWEESPYNSDIWNDLLAKTRDGIINGGTGLAPDVEEALWQRALSRQQIENDKSYQEIETYFASKGWDMPQGVMAGMLLEKSNEVQRNNLDLNRDITIKQAELAQTNTHFMLEFGRQAEVILREFHDAQANRSLDSAKAVASNSVEILNAHISRYNIRIEKYKTEAMVFGERVKASLVEIDIFKTQIESAKVSVEIQKNLVDIYDKELAAVETVMKIYSIQMDGAKTESEIEMLKIQRFSELVKAYVAEIDAEKLRYDAFNSQVEGEKVVAELYGEQVRAYVSEIDAEKAKIEIQDTLVKAVIGKNNSEIERYKAELGAYGSEIDAESKRIGGIVQGFQAEVSAYNAETDAEGSRLKAVIAEIGLRIEEGKFNLQKALAEINSVTDGYVAIKGLQLKGTEGVMSVSAQLSASAMNAVSATASYGYSGSESIGARFNYGASLTEQHSFSHETAKLSE